MAPEARYWLGYVLLQSGADPLLAGQHLAVAAGLNPHEPLYHSALAEALTRALAAAEQEARYGRFQEAVNQATAAVTLADLGGARDLSRRCDDALRQLAARQYAVSQTQPR
jgi:hypothetical protein